MGICVKYPFPLPYLCKKENLLCTEITSHHFNHFCNWPMSTVSVHTKSLTQSTNGELTVGKWYYSNFADWQPDNLVPEFIWMTMAGEFHVTLFQAKYPHLKLFLLQLTSASCCTISCCCSWNTFLGAKSLWSWQIWQGAVVPTGLHVCSVQFMLFFFFFCKN